MYADKFTLISLITHLYQPCKNLCPLFKVCCLGKFSKVTKKGKPFSLAALINSVFQSLPLQKMSAVSQVTSVVLKKPGIISSFAIADGGLIWQNLIPLSLL